MVCSFLATLLPAQRAACTRMGAAGGAGLLPAVKGGKGKGGQKKGSGKRKRADFSDDEDDDEDEEDDEEEEAASEVSSAR